MHLMRRHDCAPHLTPRRCLPDLPRLLAATCCRWVESCRTDRRMQAAWDAASASGHRRALMTWVAFAQTCQLTLSLARRAVDVWRGEQLRAGLLIWMRARWPRVSERERAVRRWMRRQLSRAWRAWDLERSQRALVTSAMAAWTRQVRRRQPHFPARPRTIYLLYSVDGRDRRDGLDEPAFRVHARP